MERCASIQVGLTSPVRVSAPHHSCYRDHDELRYSVRSVIANFRQYTDRFHLLTSDFEIPYDSPNDTQPLDFRLGQAPQWLNTESRPWSDGHIQLSVKHHAQIFHPYHDNIFNRCAALQRHLAGGDGSHLVPSPQRVIFPKRELSERRASFHAKLPS